MEQKVTLSPDPLKKVWDGLIALIFASIIVASMSLLNFIPTSRALLIEKILVVAWFLYSIYVVVSSALQGNVLAMFIIFLVALLVLKFTFTVLHPLFIVFSLIYLFIVDWRLAFLGLLLLLLSSTYLFMLTIAVILLGPAIKKEKEQKK